MSQVLKAWPEEGRCPGLLVTPFPAFSSPVLIPNGATSQRTCSPVGFFRPFLSSALSPTFWHASPLQAGLSLPLGDCPTLSFLEAWPR